MDILKNWRIHAFALLLVALSEWIGTKRVPLGPGVLLFLPMLYAMLLGAILSWPRWKVLKNEEMHAASSVLGVLTLLLVAKLGVMIGPSVGKLLDVGLALSMQEAGHFLGTVALGLPVALLLGIGREAIGATYSIDREPNLAIIAERFGLDSPEGRGTMAVYVCGTLFGAVWIGLFSGFVAALGIFHPFALAMGCGVGSGSMMAACAGATSAVFPTMSKQIMVYAGASNLLTSTVGVYGALFVALPATQYLYAKLSPRIGRGSMHHASGKDAP